MRSADERLAMAVRRALVVLTVLVGLLAWPTGALADDAGVRALLDPSSPALAPFPSNLFTVGDPDQLSGVRVSLPLPDCAALPSDCADVTVLNTLDGFSLQPRLSIPFSGPIDVSSVSSSDFFLVDVGGGAGKLIGTNQVVWEPATNTLHAASDQTLDQDRTYLLVATTAIRDAAGKPVRPSSFLHDLNLGGAKDDRLKAYRKALIGALEAAGIDEDLVAAASLFTTQSATAILEKIRDQIHAARPVPADFLLGLGGERTVFPLTGVSAIAFRQQVGTDPTLPSSFSTSSLPTPLLGAGPVGTIAFGRFSSPDYQTAAGVIPAVPTRTGTPARQSTNDVSFNLFLPSGAQPPGGWPVAIFGHGVGNSKNVSPFAVAASLAARGIATIAINAVGHGGGPLGTLTVVRTDNTTVTLPAGGRGVDQNQDGVIGSFEGLTASPPSSLVLARDGVRQTVADEMQLVRELEVGMDVDGDGAPDLDASRVFYLGQSFGGMHGTTFLAVEPAVRVGVLNVAGAPIVDVVRLSVPLRGLVSRFLGSRTPSLLNGGPAGFSENIPLRNQPPLVDTVAGADAIQEVLDRAVWIDEGGDPIGYASHVRKAPLAGVPAKSVIVQFAKGDQTVPNPATSALIRAGDLADRTTYFRNDLAYASNPAFPKDPHTFLTRISLPPPVGTVALEAQAQVATFFASDGQTLLDPDGPGPLFETPIAGPLPEELNFLP